MSRRNNNKKSGTNKNNRKPGCKGTENRIADKDESVKDKDSKSESHSGEVPTEEDKDRARNDPAWYQNLNPQLFLDAARVYSSEQFGRALEGKFPNFASDNNQNAFANSTSNNSSTHRLYPESVASNLEYGGLVTYGYNPSIGFTKNRNLPANIAAQMLYTNMRARVSGSRKYQPSDVFIHIAAIADIYSFITICKKIYAAAFSYSQVNLYIGRSILESMHIDSVDVIKNLGNFRTWINAVVQEVSAYLIPTAIPYFALKIQSAGSLYLENGYGNLKDQLYQAIPVNFYKFTLDGNGLGMLEYATAPWSKSNTSVKVSDLITFGESLLSTIRNDEDTNAINGDLARAFPAFIALEALQDEAYLAPVYDPMMLEKFRNSEPDFKRDITNFYVPWTDDDFKDMNQKMSAFYVYQNPKGELVSIPAVEITDMILARKPEVHNKHLLNVDAPEITPDVVMEATRYMANVGDYVVSSTLPHYESVDPQTGATIPADLDGTPKNIKMLDCGTEVVVSVNIIDNPNTAQGQVSQVSSWRRYLVAWDRQQNNPGSQEWAAAGTILDNQPITMDKVIQALGFKYIPWMAYVKASQTATDMVRLYDPKLITQLENYTFIGSDQMHMLHKVALMSLLCPPGIMTGISGKNAS